jgi:hypothetical protein
MLYKSGLLAAAALLGEVTADAAGNILPSSGVASTTQFYLGPELSSATVWCLRYLLLDHPRFIVRDGPQC